LTRFVPFKPHSKSARVQFASSDKGRVEGDEMKIVVNVLGALLILMGGTWFLQGVNVLPGSFMSGQPQWAVYGGLAVIAGLLLVFRRRLLGR
jgi:hypothetical protein